MERPFGRENWEGMNFRREVDSGVKEEKELQDLMKAIEEKYCFRPAERFNDKALGELAHYERYFAIPKNDMKWEEKEEKRCELKKRLEADLLGKGPLEAASYWQELRGKYCKKFDEKVKGEDKYSPQSLKKKLKRRTILDEDEEPAEKAGWSREADESFKSMMSGIDSEMVGHNVLEKVLGSDIRMTNSATDINDKIDMLAISDKEILAIQVKTSLMDIMRKNNIELIEEVGPDSQELKKREFFEGCSRMEEDLNLKNLGVKLRRIWFTIPKEYKSGDSGAYDLRLEKEARYGLDKIMRRGNV